MDIRREKLSANQLNFLRPSSTAELMKICTEYYNRLEKLESVKYDLEYEVTLRDLEVSGSL